MKKIIVRKRGLFADQYEMIEVHEDGDAIAALVTLLFLPIVIAAVVGFYLLKLLLKLSIHAAIGFHHRIDDTLDELHAISPLVAGAVVTAVIIWSLLLLAKAVGIGG